MLGLPKLLPKESTIAELLPSASTFLNTFVVRSCFRQACSNSSNVLGTT